MPLKRSDIYDQSSLTLLIKREIRNRGEYQGDLNVDERIVADLVTACSEVAAKITALKPLR